MRDLVIKKKTTNGDFLRVLQLGANVCTPIVITSNFGCYFSCCTELGVVSSNINCQFKFQMGYSLDVKAIRDPSEDYASI